jgi:hypothetical protein
MIEGLWVVQYEGIQGSGGTILVFIDGQVLGGDNGFTIIGEYEVKDRTVTAHAEVKNYLKTVPSFFDFDGDYDVKVQGIIDGPIIRGKAEIVGKGITGLALKMTKVKALVRKA